LIPAVIQSRITENNCNDVKARIVAEGANSPIGPETDKKLSGCGIFIIPDILCNADGVFVSYLEYTQEISREQIRVGRVETRLQDHMQGRFALVFDYSQNNNVTMIEAAMDIAVNRVVEAVTALGALP
jgi:glutamate dehydrogenase/leucine dehydrogenase